MASEEMGRRAFLGAAGGVALGAATLGVTTLGPGLWDSAGAANTALSALTVSIDPYASTAPQRIGLVLYRGPRPLTVKNVQVALAPPGSDRASVYRTQLFRKGLPNRRGVYVLEPTLAQPGNWTGVAIAGNDRAAFALQVKATADVPTPGSSAPRAASPTTSNPLGVNPLCTNRPRCPLHTTSLSDAIGSGKPVAVMFATPALCQTAICGPVLDELLELRRTYEDRVTFVHVEIYRSSSTATVSPTVEAWNLPGEPWLFTIDGTGTVRGRLDGAFGRQEMTAHLDAVAGA